MGKQIGIDVSEWNGNIDWKQVKSHIDFAMIRAGYGSSTMDAKFKENASGCTNHKIPFGVYWFSYALSEAMAKKEAKKCLSIVKPFKLSCPIAFDFEYDSLEYAKKKGYNISPNKMCAIARAFLDEIITAGYTVLLYTNPDFWYNKGFKNLGNSYPIWCAHWGAEKPGVYCSMWQDSNKGKVTGISGDVDTDISYIEYQLPVSDSDIKKEIEKCSLKYGEIYTEVAREIIMGQWGNGDDRVKKLKAANLDPKFVQDIVNIILKNG